MSFHGPRPIHHIGAEEKLPARATLLGHNRPWRGVEVILTFLVVCFCNRSLEEGTATQITRRSPSY